MHLCRKLTCRVSLAVMPFSTTQNRWNSYIVLQPLVLVCNCGLTGPIIATKVGEQNMKYVISIAIALSILASSVFSQTRYFLFPSEVGEFASQNARAVNVFGIATDVEMTQSSGVQFFVSDKEISIPVVYQGTLPNEFQNGNPAIVLGEFDGSILFANAVIVQFSGKYLPPAALAELQSYGVQVSQ